MCQATDKQIIEVLKMETIPALGCTEPVACGKIYLCIIREWKS